MNLPTYSICIPNYNHAGYLRRKIPQCLAQTIQPLEILVIDDGSTDESRELVEAFSRQHPIIRLVSHPKNLGVNAAIRTAIEQAKGDFVALSSADDFIAPDFAEHLLAILADHPNAGFAFSEPAELVESTGQLREVPLHLASQSAYFSPIQFAEVLRRNYFSLPSHASLYRRQALLDLHCFNPELKWCADWVVGYVLAFLHGACYVPKILAHFTIRDDSISSIGRINPEEQKAVVRTMLRTLREPPYAQTRDLFRYTALLPEHRLRSLWVVLKTDPSYIIPKLVWRCLWREAWYHAMAYVPMSWRRSVRYLLGKMTGAKTAR